MEISIYTSFDTLTNLDISKIVNYKYKNLNQYRNMQESDSNYSHMKANVIGEMYEYLIYERLLEWSIETEEVTEFILKGPYVSRNPKIKEGFLYDTKHQIYYNSGGETIAEFDSIFKMGSTVVFVEVSNTEIKALIKDMKLGIKRKRNLLRYLFPDYEIWCWIITSSGKKIDLKDLVNTELIKTKKYKIQPEMIIKNLDSSKVVMPNNSKLKTVFDLKYNEFHYYPLLSEIHKTVRVTNKNKTRENIKAVVKPYAGLIERFFIGKLSASAFIKYIYDSGYEFPRNIRVANAYLTYKIDDDLSITQSIYLSTGNQGYYEIKNLKQMDIKKISAKKRAPRDIMYLDDSLEYLSIQKWKLFIDIN